MREDTCIFCKIAKGDIPANTLYEDEDFRVILDISPASKGHALILPKEHFADITKLPSQLSAKLLPLASALGGKIRESLGADGFNILLNTGKSAGQTVFHCHLHIIPRYQNGRPMLQWEPLQLQAEELQELAARLKGDL